MTSAVPNAVNPPVAPAVPPVGGASRPSRERNAALDFTKGGLVLCMVAYHSVNYFHHDKDILRYLHFLPPSFIFIAGFLITSVYLARYGIDDPRIHARLFVRGLKLLLVFLGLNIAVNLVLATNYNRQELGLSVFWDNLPWLLLTGEGRTAVFEVLLPISYLLLLAPLLLKGCRFFRHLLPAAAGAVVVLAAVLDAQGALVFNLGLISFGMIGIAAGLIPLAGIDRLGRLLPLLIAICAAYQAVITFWYPDYLLNIVGVCLTLLLLYGLGMKARAAGPISGRIILLGKYSLLAYIAQIALLQFQFRALRRLVSPDVGLVLALIVTAAATTAVIEAVDRLRPRWPPLDRVYRWVFA